LTPEDFLTQLEARKAAWRADRETSGYSVSPQALDGLFEIWQYIAQNSEEAADRVQAEFYETFSSLAQTPGQGHSRKDLTSRHVLFFRSTPT
jgi:antitoxin ParD1/3/4/toxin ParE1/3/4